MLAGAPTSGPVGLAERVERQLIRAWHEDQCACRDFDGADLETCHTRLTATYAGAMSEPTSWGVEDVLKAAGTEAAGSGTLEPTYAMPEGLRLEHDHLHALAAQGPVDIAPDALDTWGVNWRWSQIGTELCESREKLNRVEALMAEMDAGGATSAGRQDDVAAKIRDALNGTTGES